MIYEIKLSKGKTTIVDKDDFDSLSEYKWSVGNAGYAVRSVCDDWRASPRKQRLVYMHREIIRAGKNECVDHISGDKLDNRKSNLRICTKAQNIMNIKMFSHNTSGYKGVTFYKSRDKWRAQIKFRKKNYSLGYFINIKDAADAYNIKAREFFGEFACLNKV